MAIFTELIKEMSGYNKIKPTPRTPITPMSTRTFGLVGEGFEVHKADSRQLGHVVVRETRNSYIRNLTSQGLHQVMEESMANLRRAIEQRNKKQK